MDYESWQNMLRCPFDRAQVCYVRSEGPEGAFHCVECKKSFPIFEGVIRFLDHDGAGLSTEQRREMTSRDRAATAYDRRFSAVRNTIESYPAIAAMTPLKFDLVAELGCGTGRLTRQYAHLVRRTVAIDFSFASLQILRKSLPPDVLASVLLMQADMSNPPVTEDLFQKVVAFQSLEHLPTKEGRFRVVTAARRSLVAGGTFTCTVYNWSLLKRRLAARSIGDNTRKEGFHGGEIYYYNFQKRELIQLLESAGFDVDIVRGLDMQIPGFDLIGRAAIPLDAFLSNTPLGTNLGHLLLAHANVRRTL